jgi:nucleoside 2-deoxyribosyltransferase
MKLIYIAGPFRASDAWEVHCNVHRAERAARDVSRLGAFPVTPHSIGAHFDGTETAEFWLTGTMELLRRCDAVLVLPNSGRSTGTQAELKEAERLGIPVFEESFSLGAWLKMSRQA